MIIKTILIIFCIMVIGADVFLVRAVSEMESNISDIKGFYKELYCLQKEQCESAFDKWGETIEDLDKALKLNSEITEAFNKNVKINTELIDIMKSQNFSSL